MSKQQLSQWGLLWHSTDRLDGTVQHLLFGDDGLPLIFHRRREARAYATQRFGYIKTRPDLRRLPHGWRMPMPVKLTGIVYES